MQLFDWTPHKDSLFIAASASKVQKGHVFLHFLQKGKIFKSLYIQNKVCSWVKACLGQQLSPSSSSCAGQLVDDAFKCILLTVTCECFHPCLSLKNALTLLSQVHRLVLPSQTPASRSSDAGVSPHLITMNGGGVLGRGGGLRLFAGLFSLWLFPFCVRDQESANTRFGRAQ